MAVQPFLQQMAVNARRWRDLAERRRDHMIELRSSGRWKHYHSEAEIDDLVRQAIAAAARWAEIAPRRQYSQG